MSTYNPIPLEGLEARQLLANAAEPCELPKTVVYELTPEFPWDGNYKTQTCVLTAYDFVKEKATYNCTMTSRYVQPPEKWVNT